MPLRPPLDPLVGSPRNPRPCSANKGKNSPTFWQLARRGSDAADLASVVEHLPVLPVGMDWRQKGAPEGEGIKPCSKAGKARISTSPVVTRGNIVEHIHGPAVDLLAGSNIAELLWRRYHKRVADRFMCAKLSKPSNALTRRTQ